MESGSTPRYTKRYAYKVLDAGVATAVEVKHTNRHVHAQESHEHLDPSYLKSSAGK